MPIATRRLLCTMIITTVLLGLLVAPSTYARAPITAQIVNGSSVDAGTFQQRWPFIVALVDAQARTQYDGQFCGGALIDDQHVVTAAHCVTISPGVVNAPSSISIVANTRTLSTSSRGSGAAAPRRVAEVFVHPGFGSNTEDGFHNDVAVLRLTTPIPGASIIQLVPPAEDALWGNGAGGVSAHVAGWGVTASEDYPQQRSFPATLRQTTIPLQSDARCSSTVGGGYGTAFERTTNLCGGTLQTSSALGTDSCQGDSGGPLTVQAPNQTWYLAGIVSWGEGCAQRFFGAYTRIAGVRDWIASIPGAVDGSTAIGGPGGTRAVIGLHRSGGDFESVRLAWSPSASGIQPERYGIWQRRHGGQTTTDHLQEITTSTSIRLATQPTRRANAYTWVVRPLDANGSTGPSVVIQAGPTPDTVRPTAPTRIVLAARTPRSITIRWTASLEHGSGISRYQVQHRLVGVRAPWRTSSFSGARPARVVIGSLRSTDYVIVRVRAIDRAGNVGGWRISPTFTPRGSS